LLRDPLLGLVFEKSEDDVAKLEKALPDCLIVAGEGT